MNSHMNHLLCVCVLIILVKYLHHLHHRFCHRHSLCLQAGEEGANQTRISLTDLLVCKAKLVDQRNRLKP